MNRRLPYNNAPDFTHISDDDREVKNYEIACFIVISLLLKSGNLKN